MELLRITSDSNSLRSFAATPICIVGSIASLIFSILAWGDATAMSMIFGVTGIVLAVVSVRMIGGLLAPFQWEFVIELNELRFGKAGYLKSQRLISRADIECMVFDGPADPSLFLHTGGATAFPLAPGLIHNWSQMESVIRTVQQNWPEVPVYSLEQFQAICREGRRTRRSS